MEFLIKVLIGAILGYLLKDRPVLRVVHVHTSYSPSGGEPDLPLDYLDTPTFQRKR